MPDRPNLIFIMSDQQRYDTLRCYGNDWIQTPNLNELASQSFVFENAYVTQPVCTPARASIMTGLYPHTAGPVVNKVPLPPDVPTIAEMVSGEYLCAYMGKWHLGDDVIPQHGFHLWVSSEDGHRDSFTRDEHRRRLSDYNRHLVENGFTPETELAGARIFDTDQRSELPEQFQMASFLGDQAASFIEGHADRPFLLYVSTFEPHPPYQGPLNDLYDPEQVPVGPAFLKKPEGASLLNRARADYYLQHMQEGTDPTQDAYMTTSAAVGHDVTTEAGWRRLRAQYMANITLVDRMVGRMVGALDRAGIADNTVVVFTSEHGEMAGDHGMLEKRAFYEEASRVPLLMRVPWLANEQRDVPGSVGHIDLVPTLMELMGAPSSERLEGSSLVPVLRGEKTLADNDVFIEWNGTSDALPDRDLGSPAINRMIPMPWRSVVTPDRWKLNLCATDQCELFDLSSDPHELHNRFNEPAQADRIRDMAARIRNWQHATRDTAPLPSV